MISYNNDKKIKDKYIKRVKTHRAADQIVKGKYWQDGKGCAVGCTVHSGSHVAYETELGIPRAVARLEDVIFEGLPNEIAMDWPVRFLEAVPVGSDLSMVWPKFTLWVLQEVIKYARPDGKKAINKVIDLFQLWINGNKPDVEDFRTARRAADAAADAAAAAADADAAAADAAAAYAAYAAYAAAAAAAAAYAAYAAAAAAAAADADAAAADAAAAYAAYAAADARHKFWIAAADKLIEIIKDCKA